MAGFIDSTIAHLAWWDLADHEKEQAENDAMLLRRAEIQLNDGNMSPLQEQQAQRNLELIKGGRVDPAEGSGKIFVDAAAERGGEIVGAAASGVSSLAFGKLLPFTLVIVGLIAFVLYFRFAPVKSK